MALIPFPFTPFTLLGGDRAIPVNLIWGGSDTYSLDLTNQGSSGALISNVQSVFVDNSLGAACQITVDGIGTSINVQPGVQGYYPIFMASLSRIYISGTQGSVTRMVFLDTPTDGNVYNATGIAASTTDTNIASAMGLEGGQRFLTVHDADGDYALGNISAALAGTLTVTPRSSAAGNNKSVNLPAGNTSGNNVLLATIAANALRNAVEVQNQGAVDIYVKRADGAVLILAGAGANQQGGGWRSETFDGSITIYGTTTAQFAAFED